MALSLSFVNPTFVRTARVKNPKAEVMTKPISFICHSQRGSIPYFTTDKLLRKSRKRRVR